MTPDFKAELTAIQIQVNRSQKGLHVGIRTSPKLEEFFHQASGGEKETFDLRVNGRYWTLRDGSYDLPLYSLANCEKVFNGVILMKHEPEFSGYTLDRPGRKIIDNPGGLGNIVNLSMLRAVGISLNGIDLEILGVSTEEQVIQIRNGLVSAANAFYRSFLKPVNFTINLTEN